MQKLFLQFQLIVLATTFLRAQNNSPQTDGTHIVFSTISGEVRNAVLYAPNPVIRGAALPPHVSARGVYKVDLDNGIPYDVRIVHGTGYKILDEAAVETLRNWRFRPHRLVWATIPIEFRATNSSTKH
jgi:TonB family protein